MGGVPQPGPAGGIPHLAGQVPWTNPDGGTPARTDGGTPARSSWEVPQPGPAGRGTQPGPDRGVTWPGLMGGVPQPGPAGGIPHLAGQVPWTNPDGGTPARSSWEVPIQVQLGGVPGQVQTGG